MTRFSLLESPRWQDYSLLDSGDGLKLERFGKYVFVRPEAQAMWRRARPESEWEDVHAVFQPTGEESGGHWDFRKKVEERWEMRYSLPLTPRPLPPLPLQGAARRSGMLRDLPVGEGALANQLRFWTMTTPGRHLGGFPEGAANWDWFSKLIHHRDHGEEFNKVSVDSVVNVLNLFGYTGLATLAEQI